jgi:hypothetical protein
MVTPIESSLSSTGDALSSFVGIVHGNLRQYPVLTIYVLYKINQASQWQSCAENTQ